MHLVPPLVGFGVLTTNLVEGLMCLWELQDNTGRIPSLIRFSYQRWPLKMCEDIEDNGGLWRVSHWRLWQEKTLYEAYGARRLRSFVVILLLCWVIGTTVLLSGVQENQSEWLKWCLTKTYVFEWRLWERILSRVRQVIFACSPSKVAVCVWNLTVGTHVSSLVTQGHFGQIRSGCLVAINSPPPTTINGWLLRVRVRLLSFESNPPRSLWEKIPSEEKSPNHPEPKSVRHHLSLLVCVIWRLITLEDCVSSSRLGVAFWASKSHCGLPVNEVCEGLEVYLEDLPEWLGED